MPDDPTAQNPIVPSRPPHGAHGKKSTSSWLSPKTWSKTRRWGAGISAVSLVLVVAVVALVVGGSNPTKKAATPPPSTTTPPTASTVAHKSGPTTPVCPLTGTPAPGGKVSARPALAFKIDNYPQARPWSGIDKADIVFEEPVEGFITRLVAVFQCQEAPEVGPIRSAREADQGIADLLSHPILIHVGSINQVTALLDASNLTNIDLRYPEFAGIINNPAGRYAPYDTYASTSGGWSLEPKDTTPPSAVFQYSATKATGPADNTLSIDYSSTSDETWTYQPSANSYTLSYADTGPAMVQQPSGQETQISTTNIVVQEVNYTLGPWVENDEGGLEVMVQPTGTGPLEVFRDGVFIRGTWKRASLSSPLQLTSTSGATIKLRPGTTWVEMVPAGQSITPTP